MTKSHLESQGEPELSIMPVEKNDLEKMMSFGALWSINDQSSLCSSYSLKPEPELE